MAAAPRSAGRRWSSALALCAGLTLAGGEARAADAISLSAWDSGVVDEELSAIGESVRATGRASLASSMASNPSLHGSAWAHTGSWWSVYVAGALRVSIRVQAADPTEFAPGVAVWAGDAPFDGGTESWAGETSTAGFRTPHSFNAVGPLGDPGTLWMLAGQGGNAVELLAYAVSGPSYAGVGGWGEVIEHGIHDQRLGNAYAKSVSGAVQASGVSIVHLGKVSPAWLTIYVGGTDPTMVGGQFDLEVAAQGGCGLGGERALALPLLGALRRRRRAPL